MKSKPTDANTPHSSPSASPHGRLAHSIAESDEDRLYLQVLGTFKEDGADLEQFAGTCSFHFLFVLCFVLIQIIWSFTSDTFADIYGRGISYERVLRLVLSTRIKIKEDGTIFAAFSDYYHHSVQALKNTDFN